MLRNAKTRVSKTQVQTNVHAPLFLELHKKVGLISHYGNFYFLDRTIFMNVLNFKEPINNFLTKTILCKAST
jgi:hypothetical protein